jgi:NAD(P)-dependent dehydrogenase (short-subunit alcohol dehydrogenase family)
LQEDITMPRMNLEGSSSIVTGGASGIGEASARQLAAAGSKVVIADLNEERGKQIAEEIGGVFVKCDVTSTEDADAAVAAAVLKMRMPRLPPPASSAPCAPVSTLPALALPGAPSTGVTSRLIWTNLPS